MISPSESDHRESGNDGTSNNDGTNNNDGNYNNDVDGNSNTQQHSDVANPETVALVNFEIQNDDVTDDTVNLIQTPSGSIQTTEDNGNSTPSTSATCHQCQSRKSVSFKMEDEALPCSSSVCKKNASTGSTSPPENTSCESVTCQSHESSNSSITCRICQLSETETGEPVKTSDCHCKGYLDAIHRSCLLEWVHYKGTRICEVCSSEFSSAPNLPRRSSSDEQRQQELADLFRQYSNLRPITKKKRALMGSLLVFLTVMSIVAGVLTVSTDKQFQTISSDPWSSHKSVNDSYIMFSICLSFLLFCVAVTFGTMFTWCTLEVTYHYQRQRVWQRALRIAADDHQNTA
ncbi:hypothetical protein LOTGIDRAFT_231933 [Lottia gigantea]|uniref:RING-CH-type domain-containing protein n=1 Tax=Lottia gigantea TaxID=225164 RepID=V4C2J5_LOTGI|nr:hypothetical protein LOTGIDRAFT_231933 [Lottia gigantea]ESO95739.1 hypothetical protein LOTGIDRAFT_231933 [Lottia gigantea]